MAETDVEAKQRVQKVIKAKVQPDADAAFAGVLKAVPELAKSIVKLNDAIKKALDADLIRTYARELTIHTRAVSNARLAATEALKTLKEVTSDDDDFAADVDEIEKLQAKLEAVRDRLSDQIIKAKDAADRAEKAADDGELSEKTAHRTWDSIIAEFESANALITRLLKTMRSTQQEAIDAAGKRDAATLKTKKDALVKIAHNKDVADGKLLLRRTNEFLSSLDMDQLSREFMTEIAHDKVKIIGEYDKRAQAMQAEAEKIMADMAKLTIAPPDAVKVTAKLGFKANFNARVEKALKLDEAKLMKELEAIGKDAGVKGTGKDFVAKLKKEGLYP
jgi:hypothetical protein